MKKIILHSAALIVITLIFTGCTNTNNQQQSFWKTTTTTDGTQEVPVQYISVEEYITKADALIKKGRQAPAKGAPTPITHY